jgi:hypothetical protein
MRNSLKAISLFTISIVIVACNPKPKIEVSTVLALPSVPANGPCGDLIRIPRAVHFSEHPTGHEYDVWSVTSFADPDLSRGKYVGIIERTQGLDHRPSRAIPGIEVGETGCAFFWLRIPTGGTQPEAIGGIVIDPNESWQSEQALVCYHTTHHPADAIPVIKDFPDVCDRDTTSNVRLTATVQADTGWQTLNIVWKPSGEGWKHDATIALENALGSDPSRSAQVSALITALAQPGPWFPCEASACCRLYET